MLREKVAAGTATLGPWLKEERDADTVAALLTALRERPGREGWPYLEGLIRDRKHATANRLLAVSLLLRGQDTAGDERLSAVAESVEDGPVLAEMLRGIGARKVRAASPLLLRKLSSEAVEVRAAALGALAEVGGVEAGEPVRRRLADREARVRSAAALAAGKLGLRAAAEQLLPLARDPDAAVRRSSLEALRRLREPRALPLALAALGDRETAVPALECLGDLGGPDQATRRGRPGQAPAVRGRPRCRGKGADRLGIAARAAGRKSASRSSGRLAEIHGGSGILLAWHVLGPLPDEAAEL